MNIATPLLSSTSRYRRNDYDVTNTVQVSSVASVKQAVWELFRTQWPEAPLDAMTGGLDLIDALFAGRVAGYNGIDTIYHDRQHTLDVVLAAARLLVGYERSVPTPERLGGERAVMGLLVAAFHDAGYVREIDSSVGNGAQLTRSHVSRSADLLARFLPTLGFGHWTKTACSIVHYTGYERPFKDIEAPDARDHQVGHLVGTADLIAQMADRCYLEKCRDRLYPEFVLAGVAAGRALHGGVEVRYGSGLDLLRQTPDFVGAMRRDRLDAAFARAYRFVEPLFDGRNPYIETIDQHMLYLQKILRTGNWGLLRRKPPIFTQDPDPVPSVRQLMVNQLRSVWTGS